MTNNLEAENLVDVPAVSEYKAAFLACRGRLLTDKQLEMLKQNYYAVDHTVTAGELARAVGFSTFSAANIQYGKYAGNLAAALNRKPPSSNLAILVRFSNGERTNDENVKWTLLPNVVQALEELRWVRKRE
jgi:predicted HNH restriction endonuclease